MDGNSPVADGSPTQDGVIGAASRLIVESKFSSPDFIVDAFNLGDDIAVLTTRNSPGMAFCPDCSDPDFVDECPDFCTREQLFISRLDDSYQPVQQFLAAEYPLPNDYAHILWMAAEGLANGQVAVFYTECAMGSGMGRTCNGILRILDHQGNPVVDETVFTRRDGAISLKYNPVQNQLLLLRSSDVVFKEGVWVASFDLAAKRLSPWTRLGGPCAYYASATAFGDGFAVAYADINPDLPAGNVDTCETPGECMDCVFEPPSVETGGLHVAELPADLSGFVPTLSREPAVSGFADTSQFYLGFDNPTVETTPNGGLQVTTRDSHNITHVFSRGEDGWQSLLTVTDPDYWGFQWYRTLFLGDKFVLLSDQNNGIASHRRFVGASSSMPNELLKTDFVLSGFSFPATAVRNEGLLIPAAIITDEPGKYDHYELFWLSVQ